MEVGRGLLYVDRHPVNGIAGVVPLVVSRVFDRASTQGFPGLLFCHGVRPSRSCLSLSLDRAALIPGSGVHLFRI